MTSPGVAGRDPEPSAGDATPEPAGPPSGIARVTWMAWPFVAWGLPIFLVVRGFISDNGGWEALIFLVLSPVLVPGAGLLGVLPRFLLRRKGVRTTPSPIVPLLHVHWWSWIAGIITIPGIGDSGEMPSLLRSVVSAPISRPAETVIFSAALVIAVATWLVILILAVARRPSTSPPGPGRTVVGWVALFAAPALLVGAVAIAAGATSNQRDAAGDTVTAAASRSLSEQTDLAVQRHDETQAMLVPLREEFGPTGWVATSAGFGWSDCKKLAAECYDFELGFRLDPRLGDTTPELLAERLGAEGWDTWHDSMNVSAENPAGYTLDISYSPTGVEIELFSPDWWGDVYDIRRELEARSGSSSEIAESYTYEEWPPLR
ncbi:hypothetical protein ACFXP7_06160 [Microbacterium sp. P06]|uniref:hypothetical protein n=1 Tax=Microbacterium sp. P06 TaxID=3366949 RepID=UPI003746AF2C